MAGFRNVWVHKYLEIDRRRVYRALTKAAFTGDAAAPASEPKPLLSVIGATGFAPARDGNRFVLTMSDPAVDPWPISIVLNWPATLQK